jgi:hypothetical protein
MHVALKRLYSPFARPDADGIFKGKDENFSIADFTLFAGARRVDDRLDGRFDEFVVDRYFELNFSDKVDLVFVASIYFRMPFLPADALYVGNRTPENFDMTQRLFDRFNPRGLNYGYQILHGNSFFRS